MSERVNVIHVKTWEEFKKLAIIERPAFIAYAIQNAPLSKPRIGLRLVFSAENTQYVFLDFAHCNAYRKTKLPVYINENGDAYFKEDELKSFLHNQLNRKDISIISFEAIGY